LRQQRTDIRHHIDALQFSDFHRPALKSLLLVFYSQNLSAVYSLFFKTGSYSMAKKAIKRRAWTAEQVRTLKMMARQKKRASHIAKKPKRSETATRQNAFSMGLSLDTRA
jgi:hypothetical protein